MGQQRLNLKHIDFCLNGRAQLKELQAILSKMEKIMGAIDRKMNLADIFSDPANYNQLLKIFGPEQFDIGCQLLIRLCLEKYSTKSFSINQDIEGKKKMHFLYRSVGGWKQLDGVISLKMQTDNPEYSVILINPSNRSHWESLGSIPAGTLINVYLNEPQGRISQAELQLALDRYFAIFKTAETQRDELKPVPPIQFKEHSAPAKARNGANGARSNGVVKKLDPRAMQRQRMAKKKVNKFAAKPVRNFSSEPSASFKVTINKQDTFVHAGNAQLIMVHMKEYPGRVSFFVLRDTKKRVQLDADSIWAAEIRNGEEVLFEFFGPKPENEFLKQLAKKVNKYSQMDKVANE